MSMRPLYDRIKAIFNRTPEPAKPEAPGRAVIVPGPGETPAADWIRSLPDFDDGHSCSVADDAEALFNTADQHGGCTK